MAYITLTPADILYVCNQEKLIKVGSATTDNITETDFQKHINDAMSEFYMAISGIYQIPITDTSSTGTDKEKEEMRFIKRVISELALCKVYRAVLAANTPNKTEYGELYCTNAKALIAGIVDGAYNLTTIPTVGDATTSGLTVNRVPVGDAIQSVGIVADEEEISFDGTGEDYYESIGYQNIIEGSEKVQNTARTRTYVKDTDYKIDYESGRIWLITGTAMVISTTYYVTAKIFRAPRYERDDGNMFPSGDLGNQSGTEGTYIRNFNYGF